MTDFHKHSIFQFFEQDHRRIEALLEKAIEQLPKIDETYYHQFRVGILTHIKMEEKILFPAAAKANGGVPLSYAAQLRLEHGAITSLMVVPPDIHVIKVLKKLLELHDLVEEQEGGMYELCVQLTQSETQEILDQLHATTEVPVHPFNRAEYAMVAAKRALVRAGYSFDELAACRVT